jgi:transposase-like protein
MDSHTTSSVSVNDIKVKGEWRYLYRAVDSDGNTIDFISSAKRNRKSAKRFH